MIQIGFNFLTASLGTLLTYAFGGWNELMSLFLLAIAVDYFTGIAASVKEHKDLNSQVSLWGLLRKGLMLLVIMLAHRVDLFLGTELMMTGAIYFYLANEFISITENYGRMGLPLPSQVKQIIQVLRRKGEDHR
ncbi:phage holin family protein [Paenibacillus sedimenti]|uniref:Phage holin family protein n=1 Tax=Paenibacillus sedimenti TaxID=2770274 RepID=A0A926KL03_9BACL|nr:phage holin family protein [Paenibacillus sedimenti]MBD0379729.1 phage holin family protein [Paenibacillus sedimenti]